MINIYIVTAYNSIKKISIYRIQTSVGSSPFSRTNSIKVPIISEIRLYFAYLIKIIGTETRQNKNLWKQV
jgi:hypothetical protein